MTPEKLFELHEKLSKDALKLMEGKNHDYRGGSGDPFANFRASLTLGIDPRLGILIRMSDKLARISTFIHKGTLKVKDEGVRDTVLDLINYSVLLQAMIDEENVVMVPTEKSCLGSEGGLEA